MADVSHAVVLRIHQGQVFRHESLVTRLNYDDVHLFFIVQLFYVEATYTRNCGEDRSSICCLCNVRNGVAATFNRRRLSKRDSILP